MRIQQECLYPCFVYLRVISAQNPSTCFLGDGARNETVSSVGRSYFNNMKNQIAHLRPGSRMILLYPQSYISMHTASHVEDAQVERTQSKSCGGDAYTASWLQVVLWFQEESTGFWRQLRSACHQHRFKNHDYQF